MVVVTAGRFHAWIESIVAIVNRSDCGTMDSWRSRGDRVRGCALGWPCGGRRRIVLYPIVSATVAFEKWWLPV